MLKAATECVYQPKQKPGLKVTFLNEIVVLLLMKTKPGAVEALTRRVGMVLFDCHEILS